MRIHYNKETSMKLKLFVILITLLFSTVAVFAEFYKYVDKEGNILFTDNLSEVPKNQRLGVLEYDETKKQTDSSKQSGDTEEAEEEFVDNTSNDHPVDFDNRRKALEQEHLVLKKENEELANIRKNLKTKAQIESYNKKVLSINEKIKNLKKNRNTLNVEIEEYNKSIQMDKGSLKRKKK